MEAILGGLRSTLGLKGSSSSSTDSDVLRVKGTDIVDKNGNVVLLRGCGLGGWMNMENFITGFPGREYQIRDALTATIGPEKSAFYFSKFLEYFFTEADAKFYKSLGLNCIRIAVNYRHFEDDLNPRVLKEEGIKWLDRVVGICAKEGIYTIIDLHTVPGGQNGDWHSDSAHHVAEFWNHKDFQDRAIWLWEKLADHYKGNPWIAGYNPLNEPCDPTHSRLQEWYNRVYTSIRAIDPHHILFLDGNTFASDWTHFSPPETCQKWENTVYSIHDYSNFGFPNPHPAYTSTLEERAKVRKSYEKKVEWMHANNLPIWNGEFGPVYARKQFDAGVDIEATNTSRILLLRDQLEIYDEEKIPWSIWLYKDIGFQGMVHIGENTAHMRLFKDFLLKKHRLAIDAWGADSTSVDSVYKPLEAFIAENVDPKYRELYPAPVWKFEARIGRLSRNMLLAEFLVQEWADHFVGKSFEELDELAASFKFENCVQREELNATLVAHKDAAPR
ncbi:glycoside hydrolase superfamily [Peziza echinospora]|nr:glycoside hydrolase superfamily [Peziza echinospora]